jgi:hypothetical protein
MDKRAEANMRIWKALGKTDPAHTKQFQRAGGFRGTAIKPIWITQRLTELFGPAGVGWGTSEPQFTTVCGQDGEVLVYCTVAGWYRDDPETANVFPDGTGKHMVYGVGGDKAVAWVGRDNSRRIVCDDEAFKKAFTDAIGNAFKFVGVGADVHMGLFDDSKYVAEVREEFHPKPDNPTTGEPKKREKTALDGPYDTLPKLEKAAREFARTLRGIGTVEEFEEWKQDADVIAFVEQCKRDLPAWWFANHPDAPPDFTALSVEVASTLRGLRELAEVAK